MTIHLDQVIERVRQLPDEQQEQIAALIEQALEAEQRWSKLLSSPESEKFLELLDAEIEQEERAGLTQPLMLRGL